MPFFLARCGIVSLRQQTRRLSRFQQKCRSLHIARCPDGEALRFSSLACSKCDKVFVSKRALDQHTATHATHPHVCPTCKARVKNLSLHARMHRRRVFIACDTCGEEFLTQAALERHYRETDGKPHSSAVSPIRLHSPDQLEQFFIWPREVALNSLVHTTSSSTARQILSSQRIEANKSRVYRVHDGELRMDGAPPAAFFSLALAQDTFQRVSFHPKFAEPGELVASLFVDLNSLLIDYRKSSGESDRSFTDLVDGPFTNGDTFEQELEEEPKSYPNSGHRLYLVNCAPTGKRKRSPLRATVLFAREKDWAWCEARQFIELDILNNPILCARKRDTRNNSEDEAIDGTILPRPESTDFSWRVATRFHSQDLGLRDLNVIVCVANGIDLSESTAEFGRMDIAHSFSTGRDIFCPFCDRSFSHYEQLFSHMSSHDGPSYFCGFSECTKSFGDASTLRRHERIHLDDRPFACTEDGCSQAFHQSASMRAHVRQVHLGERKFPCEEPGCDKAFSSRHRLAYHRSVHTGNMLKCTHPRCSAEFQHPESLKRHVEKEHEGVRLACTYKGCPAKFRNRVNLVRHINAVHEGVSYPCDYCYKTFRYPDSLWLHVKTFHSEKTQKMASAVS